MEKENAFCALSKIHIMERENFPQTTNLKGDDET
jgi:hypothetical protein